MIKRAFHAYQSHNRQPYGAYPGAGQHFSAKLSRRRRQYKTSYGHGISRVQRKALWHRGRQFGWVGAVIPGTVGGRRAHPPKAHKDFEQKINKKERKKALRSALAATFNQELVKNRGHHFDVLPAVVESKMETLAKTQDVEKMLMNLKLERELQRISVVKVRAGRGKMRNRKYKVRKGPLFVVSKECPLQKAAENMLGVEICIVNNLNVNVLAPGGAPGRLTIFSEDAIKKLASEELFLDTHIKTNKPVKPVKEAKKEAPKAKPAAKPVAKKPTVKPTKAVTKK
jgi:large subunit ribosomal protein L4e